MNTPSMHLRSREKFKESKEVHPANTSDYIKAFNLCKFSVVLEKLPPLSNPLNYHTFNENIKKTSIKHLQEKEVNSLIQRITENTSQALNTPAERRMSPRFLHLNRDKSLLFSDSMQPKLVKSDKKIIISKIKETKRTVKSASKNNFSLINKDEVTSSHVEVKSLSKTDWDSKNTIMTLGKPLKRSRESPLEIATTGVGKYQTDETQNTSALALQDIRHLPGSKKPSKFKRNKLNSKNKNKKRTTISNHIGTNIKEVFDKKNSSIQIMISKGDEIPDIAPECEVDKVGSDLIEKLNTTWEDPTAKVKVQKNCPKPLKIEDFPKRQEKRKSSDDSTLATHLYPQPSGTICLSRFSTIKKTRLRSKDLEKESLASSSTKDHQISQTEITQLIECSAKGIITPNNQNSPSRVAGRSKNKCLLTSTAAKETAEGNLGDNVAEIQREPAIKIKEKIINLQSEFLKITPCEDQILEVEDVVKSPLACQVNKVGREDDETKMDDFNKLETSKLEMSPTEKETKKYINTFSISHLKAESHSEKSKATCGTSHILSHQDISKGKKMKKVKSIRPRKAFESNLIQGKSSFSIPRQHSHASFKRKLPDLEKNLITSSEISSNDTSSIQSSLHDCTKPLAIERHLSNNRLEKFNKADKKSKKPPLQMRLQGLRRNSNSKILKKDSNIPEILENSVNLQISNPSEEINADSTTSSILDNPAYTKNMSLQNAADFEFVSSTPEFGADVSKIDNSLEPVSSSNTVTSIKSLEVQTHNKRVKLCSLSANNNKESQLPSFSHQKKQIKICRVTLKALNPEEIKLYSTTFEYTNVAYASESSNIKGLMKDGRRNSLTPSDWLEDPEKVLLSKKADDKTSNGNPVSPDDTKRLDISPILELSTSNLTKISSEQKSDAVKFNKKKVGETLERLTNAMKSKKLAPLSESKKKQILFTLEKLTLFPKFPPSVLAQKSITLEDIDKVRHEYKDLKQYKHTILYNNLPLQKLPPLPECFTKKLESSSTTRNDSQIEHIFKIPKRASPKSKRKLSSRLVKSSTFLKPKSSELLHGIMRRKLSQTRSRGRVGRFPLFHKKTNFAGNKASRRKSTPNLRLGAAGVNPTKSPKINKNSKSFFIATNNTSKRHGPAVRTSAPTSIHKFKNEIKREKYHNLNSISATKEAWSVDSNKEENALIAQNSKIPFSNNDKLKQSNKEIDLKKVKMNCHHMKSKNKENTSAKSPNEVNQIAVPENYNSSEVNTYSTKGDKNKLSSSNEYCEECIRLKVFEGKIAVDENYRSNPVRNYKENIFPTRAISKENDTNVKMELQESSAIHKKDLKNNADVRNGVSNSSGMSNEARFTSTNKPISSGLNVNVEIIEPRKNFREILPENKTQCDAAHEITSSEFKPYSRGRKRGKSKQSVEQVTTKPDHLLPSGDIVTSSSKKTRNSKIKVSNESKTELAENDCTQFKSKRNPLGSEESGSYSSNRNATVFPASKNNSNVNKDNFVEINNRIRRRARNSTFSVSERGSSSETLSSSRSSIVSQEAEQTDGESANGSEFPLHEYVSELKRLDKSISEGLNNYRKSTNSEEANKELESMIPKEGPKLKNYPNRPPEWFLKFIANFRKQELWRLHQMFKIHDHLMRVESAKLNMLEKAYESLKGNENITNDSQDN